MNARVPSLFLTYAVTERVVSYAVLTKAISSHYRYFGRGPSILVVFLEVRADIHFGIPSSTTHRWSYIRICGSNYLSGII